VIPYQQRSSIGQACIDLVPEITDAILQTIAHGWELANRNQQLKTLATEVPITESLRRGMREALRSQGLPWGKSMMIVLPGAESKSTPELLTPDGRTDIPLMFIGVFLESGEHDPHAIIECKRVAEGDVSLIRDYVVEGVDRFRTGKYAANHSRGFMAGYVISGHPVGVVAGINAYLNKKSRSGECLLGQGPTWRSEHARKNSNKIELHHSMLLI
jgi:hypothetical protein